eukprot:9349860-Lingulodinium_polyedra.AAC.1
MKETWVKELIAAPRDIVEAFLATKAQHEKGWQNVLSDYAGSANEEGGFAQDDRDAPVKLGAELEADA